MMVKLAVFVLMNGLVFGGAALVARHGLKFRERMAVGLATVLLGWVTIVFGLEALGLFGQIRLLPALGLAACGFATGIVCWWKDRGSEAKSEVIGASQAGLSHPPDVPRADVKAPSRSRSPKWSALIAVSLAVWAAVDVLIVGLCSPVQPISDAPIYHLYFSVRWWQSGTLEIVPTPFGESAAPYFPANASVWFTWLVLPWDSEILAKVGQWPFLIVGMLAIYALVCELGVRRVTAIFPAVLWGTGTIPLINSGFADVDLVMAAWYLVATWFLVRYSRRHQVADLACSALAAGAALGTKYIAVLFVPWLILASVFLAWRSPNRWMHWGVIVIGVAAPSAFWFVRNAVLTGNPLYPLHVEILGFPILGGWYSRETLLRTSGYHIPVSDWASLVLILLRNMDPILVPLWLAGVVAAVWSTTKKTWLPWLLVVLGLLHIVLFWVVNPYQTQDRFLFAAMALLAVPVAILLDRWTVLSWVVVVLIGWHLTIGPKVVVRCVELVFGMNLPAQPLPPLLPAALPLFGVGENGLEISGVTAGRIALLSTVIMAFYVVTRFFRGTRFRRVVVGIGTGLIAVAGLGIRISQSRIPDGPYRFYPIAPQIGYTPGWLWLAESSRRPTRVAYAGTNLPFYLFGRGLQNEVRYVNINENAGLCLHDYHSLYAARGEPLAASSTPDWDRREADETAWLRNLRDQRVEHLFVGFTNRAGGEHNFYDREGFPIERTWADRHPDVFHLIHADGRTHLYTVQFR